MENNLVHRPRAGLQWRNLLLGAGIGLIAGLVAPRPYVADVSLFFPTINDSAFKQITKLFKVDGSAVDWEKTPTLSDQQVLDSAALIFKSRAALISSLQDSKITLPPARLSLQQEPLESFRAQDIQVDGSDRGALHLRVTYPRPEGARAICQGLLNYYTTFVHEHRLTNTARTRLQLEEKLVRVDRRLSVLEKKLLAGSGAQFRSFGDLNGKDSKVVRELWKQRILEGGSSGRVLDEMRKIRKEAAKEGTEAVEAQATAEDWRNRWGSTTLEDPGSREGSLPRNARRTDLPSRLELERVYEETILLYHAGLLQYDFLSVWEGLENFDFEIVDPVTVHREDVGTRVWQWSLVGGFLGLLLGWLFKRQG